MFGDRIEKISTAYNWTQVQLARKLNVSKQTVSNWENNNILPSIEMLIKLSGTLSVSTDYLLSLDDREYIEVTGLTKIQKAHIQQLIHDLQEKKPNMTIFRPLKFAAYTFHLEFRNNYQFLL